ncbi:MAG: hypothetical protein QOG68_1673 [Solirubrobacteraceae bacterium]|nr:hypothetical protein [Solirubrobacteraceae bacterium]
MSAIGRVVLLVLLLAPATARAAEPISQFHLAANARVTTKVTVRAGTVYPMEISGTQTTLDSRFRGESELHDTFYCFQSTPKRSCPDMPRPGASVYPSSSADDLLPMASSVDGGQIPAYSPDHRYSFGYKAKTSGTLVMTSQPNCDPCTGEGFDIKIFAPTGPEDPCAVASQCATVVGVSGEVSVRAAGGGPLRPLKVGAQLTKGDELVTGVDADAQLKFADGTIMKVSEMTELLIADLLVKGSRQAVIVALKLGEVSAQVNPKHAFQTDFKVTTPSGTAGVRGTVLSVFYDPSSKTMIETTREGSVEVDPAGPGLATTVVPAGKEVQVTPKAITALAPIGKAGARGGLNRRDALVRVLEIVTRAKGPCKISTPRTDAFAVKSARGGWAVAIKLTGRHRGTSQWTVKGRQVVAVNPLAKKLRRGCR